MNYENQPGKLEKLNGSSQPAFPARAREADSVDGVLSCFSIMPSTETHRQYRLCQRFPV